MWAQHFESNPADSYEIILGTKILLPTLIEPGPPHDDTGGATQDRSGDVAGEQNPFFREDGDPMAQGEVGDVAHGQGLGAAHHVHLICGQMEPMTVEDLMHAQRCSWQ